MRNNFSQGSCAARHGSSLDMSNDAARLPLTLGRGRAMRVLVGMSGGFDSALAARKLIDAGHTVEGATLVMHEYADTDSAMEAADKLGIPLHIIDCKELFAKNVKENFKNEYKNGRTPNPCVVCNPTVKFYELRRYALEHGFDRIATGHYARIVRCVRDGAEYPAIARARDTVKDQSYMLYRLPRDILNMLILPLSEEVKSELRDSARGTELEDFDKPDSQEICFIPDGDYVSYVEEDGKLPCGSFVDTEGNALGMHKGIAYYTVGQRKGLGIALGERMFVTALDAKRNEVTLDTRPPESSKIEVDGLCFAYPPSVESFRASVKIRYAVRAVEATVTLLPSGRAIVHTDAPVRSVTPGQSAVFYDGDIVIGGGFIVK